MQFSASGFVRGGGCKFIIQNSRFKIKRALVFSERSLRSARKFGYKLQAFAGRNCGPHDLLRGRFCEIQALRRGRLQRASDA